MRSQDGIENVMVEKLNDDCSEELIRAIERNRIEMEIAWLRAEDLAGVLDSARDTYFMIMSKYSKSKSN